MNRDPDWHDPGSWEAPRGPSAHHRLSIGTAMRHSPSMIRFCLQKAAECRRCAEQATDPLRRQSWLELEGRWFFLARSYDNQRRADMPLRTLTDTRSDDRAKSVPPR
jgi:hypothetical protein